MNCAMNGSIATERKLSGLFVQPGSNDAGTALGAALMVSKLAHGARFRPTVMRHSYFGLRSDANEIEAILASSNLKFKALPPDELVNTAASLLE